MGKAHCLAMREDVAVGTDAGIADAPLRDDIAVSFVAIEKIVNPSSAGGENSIGAQVVAMIHVDENLATRREQAGDRAECALPFFRGRDVP